MKENLKKFVEYASQHEETREKLVDLGEDLIEEGNVSDKDAAIGRVIEIAKEAGFALSAEDFAAEKAEISEEELELVSGGKTCVCALGGGGEASTTESVRRTHVNRTCVCVVGGGGVVDLYYKNGYGADKKNVTRCCCPLAGFGGDW